METAHPFEALRPYTSNLDTPIYALTNLPEEVVAVLFAYYSRSQGSLRENLLQLISDRDLVLGEGGTPVMDQLLSAQEKAASFHSKWTIAYGHGSVAEHAVLHLAIEDVSILCSKIIEDCRLASYTEKSTRYVPWSRDKIHQPLQFIMGQDVERPETFEPVQRYTDTIKILMDTYEEILKVLPDQIAGELDRSQFKTDRGFRNSCVAQACDSLRYLLPAAAVTNIGLSTNARELAHMISKLQSHPLQEAQLVGARLLEEGKKVCPTLLKYAGEKPFFQAQHATRAELPKQLSPDINQGYTNPWDNFPPVGRRYVQVLDVQIPGQSVDQDVNALILAHLAYEGSDLPWQAVLNQANNTLPLYRQALLQKLLAQRGTHDPFPRALEALTVRAEMMMDYGAYRDLQRHRMCTQWTQELKISHGYETPPVLEKYGHAPAYHRAMEAAAAAYQDLRESCGGSAGYVVPLGYRIRTVFQWNLRSLAHFIALRSSQQGHPSYRWMAQELYRKVTETAPSLTPFLTVDETDYPFTRPEK